MACHATPWESLPRWRLAAPSEPCLDGFWGVLPLLKLGVPPPVLHFYLRSWIIHAIAVFGLRQWVCFSCRCNERQKRWALKRILYGCRPKLYPFHGFNVTVERAGLNLPLMSLWDHLQPALFSNKTCLPPSLGESALVYVAIFPSLLRGFTAFFFACELKTSSSWNALVIMRSVIWVHVMFFSPLCNVFIEYGILVRSIKPTRAGSGRTSLESKQKGPP